MTNQPVAPQKNEVTDEETINSEDKTVVQQISTACSKKAEASLNDFGPPTKACLQQPANISNEWFVPVQKAGEEKKQPNIYDVVQFGFSSQQSTVFEFFGLGEF